MRGTRAGSSGRHPVADAVDAWLTTQQLDQIEVATKAGISYQRLNKMLTREGAKPQLDLLCAIETAYDLRIGYFLRRAGFVEDELSPEDAIRADNRIPEHWRQSLLDMYQAALLAGPHDSSIDFGRGL